jgi:hypothetical protein
VISVLAHLEMGYRDFLEHVPIASREDFEGRIQHVRAYAQAMRE